MHGMAWHDKTKVLCVCGQSKPNSREDKTGSLLPHTIVDRDRKKKQLFLFSISFICFLLCPVKETAQSAGSDHSM